MRSLQVAFLGLVGVAALTLASCGGGGGDSGGGGGGTSAPLANAYPTPKIDNWGVSAVTSTPATFQIYEYPAGPSPLTQTTTAMTTVTLTVPSASTLNNSPSTADLITFRVTPTVGAIENINLSIQGQ